MIILGLDGIATVGFGVISAVRSEFNALQYGAIRTEAGLPLSERLETIYDDMDRLIDTFTSGCGGGEAVFNTNHKTGIAVAHGRSHAAGLQEKGPSCL